MKKRILPLLSGVALAIAVSSAFADTPTNTTQKHYRNTTDRRGENYIEVTGSHIKRHVQDRGIVTDSSSPVTTILPKEIERSGAVTASDLLRKYPGVFVHGD